MDEDNYTGVGTPRAARTMQGLSPATSLPGNYRSSASGKATLGHRRSPYSHCTARAADRHRLLLGHRGGDALGQPLRASASRCQRPASRAPAREPAAKPDEWLGANLVILALASVAASTIATLLALAHRLGAMARAAHDGPAHGGDDRVLRTGAEDLCGRCTPKRWRSAPPTCIARCCG